MITRKLIERIEGEASVDFEWSGERIDFASIRFPHIRGMERILKGRPALDALIVTPRTCGICGHSHLMTTVKALESAYAAAGVAVTVTPKAEKIRELTLMMELVQNHFKWFYLVIYPELARMVDAPVKQNVALKGAFAAATLNRALAIFAGQWPHSSYALPGGVTCDPTQVDLVRAEAAVDEVIRFFERELAGISLDHFLVLKSCKEINPISSDMADAEVMLMRSGMFEKGHGFDRFIVLGEEGYGYPAKIVGTTLRRTDTALAETSAPYITRGRSEALNARYNGNYYETGPLARAMSMGFPLIKNMHRRFKDSAYTRVFARIYETAQLLHRIKQHLHEIDLSEPSYLAPGLPIRDLSARGEGVVEAPRGPLIHRLEIENGVISGAEMITPTQWNLGSGTKEEPGIAQKAMKGCRSVEEAIFIFRTFDVCSVCTTH